MNITRTHKILFALTVATTLIQGYVFEGSVLSAVSFSAALLFILGSHEMGHYHFGRKYGVNITPPYFIPAPPYISPIGTFGAFIKIKSPITNKRALFDIGVAGPLAGIVATIPVLIIGLKLSTIVEADSFYSRPDVMILDFGNTLIFSYLSDLVLGKVASGYAVEHHPVAFAGWVGLFITALNLIPSGQLDGGHIIYSLVSKKVHSAVSISMVVILVVIGLGTVPFLKLSQMIWGGDLPSWISSVPVYDGWPGWILWAVLLTILGTKHPPTIDEHTGLDFKRKVLAVVALLVFIGCFSPVPIVVR